MNKIIYVTAIIVFGINVLTVAQTKEKQAFKFNIVKNDTMFFKDLSPLMELVAADKSLEIISYDMIFYVYEDTYKFSMNGSKLAESLVTRIKDIKPQPRKMVVDNIVAYKESDGKEKPYKGFTLYLK